MVEKCEGYKIETNRNNQKLNIGFQKYLYTVLNKNSSIINELYIGNNEIVTELLISENRKYDVIYIDPPYNALDSGGMLSEKKVSDEIWMKYIYKILSKAKILLSKRGIIFISINDQEAAETRIICNNIFGKNNFMAQIVRKRTNEVPKSAKIFARVHEYILVFAVNAIDIYTEWSKKAVSTWWDASGYDSDAKKDIEDIFGEIVFDYAKPVKLIKQLLSIFDKPDLNVLDLYAGSGTTAQAIFSMNNEDNGKRRFTLVQKKEIYMGKDISDICLKRIELVMRRYNVQNGCVVYQIIDN